MVVFHRISREAMARNHERATPPRVAVEPSVLVPKNFGPVLDFGDIVYLTFRGRCYGVPPVPWKVGSQLLGLRYEAIGAAGATGIITPATAPTYFKAVAGIAALCWRHCRPVGRLLRLAKRLGLMRNPFASATEAEVVALADFFAVRRMSVSVGFPEAGAPLHPATH